MYPLLFSYFLLVPHSLGMAMSVLHFLYLVGPYPWNIGNVWFIFLLYVIALCTMHVYIHTYIHTYIYIYIYKYVCLFMYGWLCTLYDGLLWLRERSSLVTRALDLVVWLCIQGDCHRCTLMLYYVHDHCCVIVLIHSPSDIGFPMYATRINVF